MSEVKLNQPLTDEERTQVELQEFNNPKVSDYLEELYFNLGQPKVKEQTLKALFSQNI